MALIELAERAAYYGVSGPFQNYIQNTYKSPSGLPGALGLGQSAATRFTNFFQFFCYVTPVFGLWSSFLLECSKCRVLTYLNRRHRGRLVPWQSQDNHLLLCGLYVWPSHTFWNIPANCYRERLCFWRLDNRYDINRNVRIGLFLSTTILTLHRGTGGIKSNVSPLIAEQYTRTKQSIRNLDSGERVIVDPAMTIERIYTYFYMCINVGSLSSALTTVLELKVGFWLAYLVPVCIFGIGFTVLVSERRSYIDRPPSGSVVLHAFRIIWIGIWSGHKLDAAKSSFQRTEHRFTVPWSDEFVEEIKVALASCRVFLFFPIYWM